MTERDLLERAAARLNEALEADPQAMTDMCWVRVPCNQKLADHPTIEVGAVDDAPGNAPPFDFGPIGLINGLLRGEPPFRHALAYQVRPPSKLIEKFLVVEITPPAAADSQSELSATVP